MQASGSRTPATRRGHLRAAAIGLMVAVVLLGAGCRPPAERGADPERQVEVALVTTPARVGPAVVEVRVAAGGTPADGASVRVVGDMTHAGMAPVVASAAGLGGGLYRTTDFAFDMAGDWVITAEVTYPDAATRQAALPVTVAR